MLFGLFKKRPNSDTPSTALIEAPSADGALSGVKPVPRTGQSGERPDRALIDALAESRRHFKEIVEVSGDFAWETDAAGAFVFVSPGLTLACRPEELIGAPATRFMAENGVQPGETPFEARAAVRDVDIWLRASDGRDVCLSASAIPIIDDKVVHAGARGVCRDVTEDCFCRSAAQGRCHGPDREGSKQRA